MRLNQYRVSLDTSPQDGAYISYMSSLSQIKSTHILPSDLIRISANWCPDDTCFVTMIFSSSSYELYDNQPQCVWFSHGTRHFVLLFHIVLWETLRENQSLIQISSNVTFIITLYSDSSLDWETTLYFLLFHDTRFPPRKTQYHVIDLLLKGTTPSLHLKSLLL